MNEGAKDGGWWVRFKRFFLSQFGIGVRPRPTLRHKSGRGGSSSSGNSYTHSHGTAWGPSREPVFVSSDPVYVSPDASAIADLASSLDRRADRYENAGDTGRAAELYRAAENVRESGSYEQAREYAREADHPFITTSSATSDSPWSANDFGQSSPSDQTFANAGDFGTGFSDNS